MKSFSLSRPLVIFMIGLPGAGKSFFARQFAETFKAPIVSHDYLRYQMFPEPAFSNDEDKLIAQIAGNEFSELLKTQRSIILDGGSNDYADRQDLTKLAKKHGYGSLIVWVQTDELACRKRATKRSAKRSGDELNMSMTDHDFEIAKSSFMPPGKSEDFIVISGKHTYATQAKVVLRRFVTSQPVVDPETPKQPERTSQHGDDIQPRRRSLTIS